MIAGHVEAGVMDFHTVATAADALLTHRWNANFSKILHWKNKFINFSNFALYDKHDTFVSLPKQKSC